MSKLLAGSLICGALVGVAPAAAQESASYRLRETVLNAGGNPTGGTSLSSASFRIRFDAIGASASGTGLASATFRADVGLLAAYPPPGEVMNLVFTSKVDLTWGAERSAGTYDLYRGLVSLLPTSAGTCLRNGLASPTTVDGAIPAVGTGFCYLATVKNRLREEGTLGLGTNGTGRPVSSPCP